MNNIEKARLFLPKLISMVSELEKDKRLMVHNQVNQFNYMTRVEELRFLLDQYDIEKAALDDTSNRIGKKYSEVVQQYDHDREIMAKL